MKSSENPGDKSFACKNDGDGLACRDNCESKSNNDLF